MAYTSKYYTHYKRRSGGTTTIHIYQKDSAGSQIYLKADVDPLVITTIGDVNNIYQPTQGSGATIKLLVTPLTLIDFFTVDPQKFMVKVFNGTSGGTITWQGFISTGIYTEDYSVGGTLLTPITLQCNDGMSVLDNMYYSQSATGATYTGFTNVSTVMSNIFSKLAISFTSIITNHNLKISEFTTNLFLYLTVNNENYIDELERPFSCRKVLDSIFGALGLVMTFRGQTIYLLDPINLHDTDNGMSYDTSPAYGSSESAYPIGGYLDISNGDIEYYETGQSIDVVQPFNQLEVRYDPYNFTQGTYNFNTEENQDTSGTLVIHYTDDGVDFNIYKGTEMNGWTATGTNKFEGWQQSGTTVGNIDYMIRQDQIGSGYYEYVIPYSNIKQDEEMRLELSMDVYVNTKDENNLWSKDDGILVNEIQIPVYLKVGNQWYGGGNLWQTDQIGFTMTIREVNSNIAEKYITTGILFWKHTELVVVDSSIINDAWTTGTVSINMGQSSEEDLINGSITIYIPKVLAFESVTPSAAEASILNLLIKNISVTTTTTSDIPISNEGILTTTSFYNNNTIKKDELNITLLNGCGNYGASKASFSTDQQVIQGINITGLMRGDDTTLYDTTQLLSQSLISQYKEPRYLLKANFDVSDNLLSTEHKLIKDSDYLADVAFYISNGTYNDWNENYTCEMIELVSTRETI